MPLDEQAPGAVLMAAKALLGRGLVEGTAGNISGRQRDGRIVITPAAFDYHRMGTADLVVVDFGGTTIFSSGPGREPTSEAMLHLACYRSHSGATALERSAADAGCAAQDAC